MTQKQSRQLISDPEMVILKELDLFVCSWKFVMCFDKCEDTNLQQQ